MIPLLLHLTGDYILQTSTMARRKVDSWFWACLHATVYTLPFLLVASWQACLVIGGTHAVIDRFSVAKAVIGAKNCLGSFLWWLPSAGKDFPHMRMLDKALGEIENGRHNWGSSHKVPPHIAFFVYVVVDNTLHLWINYFAMWRFP